MPRLSGPALEKALNMAVAEGVVKLEPHLAISGRMSNRGTRTRQADGPATPGQGHERVETPGAGGVVSPGHRPASPPWLSNLSAKQERRRRNLVAWRTRSVTRDGKRKGPSAMPRKIHAPSAIARAIKARMRSA
jgi:hypothetical protein